jgi:hypothetical protein
LLHLADPYRSLKIEATIILLPLHPSRMSNNTAVGQAVQPQWEVGQTTFSTVNKLRELIGIASQDNIQPQAVLAAESLGLGLVVSPKRIGEAVEALGGNDSTRLESIRAFIGLNSGNIHRIMRHSTPLLQFFLVITASKLCYTDTELGDLAFQMMIHTSVLKSSPVASSQLAQLIRTFSGQSESVVPFEVLSDIALAVDRHDPGSGLYARIDADDLAMLLIRAFENIRDEAVHEVVFKGHHHAVWLATFFWWLLPEKTCIVVGDDVIKGSTDAKLTINIQPVDTQPWEMQTWKGSGDPTKYVFSYDTNDVGPLNRLPIHEAKSYFEQFYCSAYEDRKVREKAITAMGDLAGALTCLLVERGKLYLPKDCCKENAEKCASARVSDIISTDWMSEYSRTALKYGWGDITNGQFQAQKLLDATFSDNSSSRSLIDKLQDACSSFIGNAVGCNIEASYITDPAMYIALDAIATSTVTVVSGKRYFSPLSSAALTKTERLLASFFSEHGVDVREFRRLAFTQLLLGSREIDDADLVVSQNGYVAGMSAVWQCSTLQRDALAIRYTKGQIKYDTADYDSIREVDVSAYVVASAQEPVSLIQHGKYLGLTPQSENFSFETKVSIMGSVLAVKRYMLRPKADIIRGSYSLRWKVVEDGSERQRASWISSLLTLAMARHIDRGNELTPMQEQLLAERLYNEGLDMRWASGFDYTRSIGRENPPKILLKTYGKEEVRFFAAGLCLDNTSLVENCLALVIRHNAPLLSCIYAAEKTHEAWVVAC